MGKRSKRGSPVERIDVRGLGGPMSDYSSVVAVQGAKLLFVSGKVPVDADGHTVGVGDVEAQCRQAMINLQAALHAAGARLEDVVKVTALLADRSYFPVWRRVRREFFPKDFPASTGFAVAGLGDERWVIEVEAIAAVPEDSAKSLSQNTSGWTMPPPEDMGLRPIRLIGVPGCAARGRFHAGPYVQGSGD